MKIRPLYDRVVVTRIKQLEEAHGGLCIPDSAKEKPQEGEVMVGRSKRLEDGKVVQTMTLRMEDGRRLRFR